MNFRQLLQDYFTFSRNERKGLIILLILIFLLAVVNKVMFHFEKMGKTDRALFDSAKEELGLRNDSVNFRQRPAAVLPRSGLENSSYRLGTRPPKETTTVSELFLFDPNIATDDDFYRLGFTEKQVVSIRKYMKSGVVFRNKDDFFRIKVITENQRKRLVDYVVIGQNENTSAGNEVVSPVLVSIELNSADSVLLKQLPGIGDKLSKRIVKYRDLLGGFYSVSQLKEVYGLREETINDIAEKVTVDISKIKKIDLNFADVSELSRHPYLQKDLAKRIVKFRSEKGSIRSLDVLRDSMILNIDDYNRLKPYF